MDAATNTPKPSNYEASVTVIALLRLSPPRRLSDTSIQSTLRHCLQVLRDWASHPFYLYSCLEDATLVYIIGSWASVTQHRQEFLPSVENQTLLQLVDGNLDVEWMIHVDLPIEKLPLSAPVMSIRRSTLLPPKLQSYAVSSLRLQKELEMRAMGSRFAQGRKIEKADEEGYEVVVFVGWDDQARSEEF